MTTVLFWDIDGTLLTTGRAGIFALQDAASEIVQTQIDLSDLETAGLTDWEIATKILTAHNFLPDTLTVQRLLQRYGEYLPASLPRRQGAVLRGVREILDHLQRRTDVVSMLLTGNIQAGAQAKLAHYGLDGYFTQGAFADQAVDRPTIARQALSMAQATLGDVNPDKLYVIGDTPHDIHCGQVIGARVVAVASGSYSVKQLQEHRPWWVLESLPEPAMFLSKIGLNTAEKE